MQPQKNDPYYDAGMRGHIVNMAKKNLWRMSKMGYELDDMIQEAMICYYKCHHKYIGARPKKKPNGKYRRYLPPKNPDPVATRHFMRLVQRAFRNHIFTLADKSAGGREVPISQLVRPEQLEASAWDQLIPPEQELASVSATLANAPTEIVQLFRILISNLVEGGGKIGAYYRTKCVRDDGTLYEVWAEGTYLRSGKRGRVIRETNNQYWCRLLGIPERDIEGEVARLFLA